MDYKYEQVYLDRAIQLLDLVLDNGGTDSHLFMLIDDFLIRVAENQPLDGDTVNDNA